MRTGGDPGGPRWWGRNCALAGLVLGLLPIAGCGSFLRQPENVEVTRQEVEALRRDQAEALALLREFQVRLADQDEALTGIRADTNLELREISDRLQTLIAQFEEQGMRIERIQRAPRRVTGPIAEPPDTSGMLGGLEAIDAGPTTSAVDLLSAADRDFRRGNYTIAASAYEEYLRFYPDTPEAAAAQYGLAESFYSGGHNDRAIEEFLRVRDVYPDSEYAARATHKVGLAFLRSGDEVAARRYLEMVVREFPDTEEARLASERLNTLGNE